MATSKGVSGLLARLRKPKPQNQSVDWGAGAANSLAPSASVLIARNHFVFGLDWQFFADRKEFAQALRALQSKGGTHYILSSSGEMVGAASGVDKNLGKKPLSAAVHLAETSSLGGVEAFVFELPDGLFSFTALNESQPVPNFDQVGSEQEIIGLISEYQALQSDQPIRFVGNVEFIESIEKVPLNEVFARPDSASHLSVLPNYRLRKLILVILLPSFLAFAAGAAWFQHQRQIEEQERLAREQDPNYIYENAVGPAMQQTGLQAQITLERWREVVYHLPTHRAGWKLEKITCKPTTCSITWQRDYGSYQDFQAEPIDGVVSSSESQSGDSPSKANVTTIINIPILPGEEKGLSRPSLPVLRDVLQQVASQLQDISLVPNFEVKLKQPELYPSTGATVAQINNPVVRGEWSMTHELWTLGELFFDHPTLVMQSLTVQQEEKTQDWIYTLTGNYYAKGKN